MLLIYAPGALNPRAHYVSSMSTGQLNDLRTAFERMTYLDTVVETLSEAQTFCMNASSFLSPLAQKWRLMIKCRLVCIFFNFI
jgi:phage gp37-like protein